jgi:hypothetical protein
MATSSVMPCCCFEGGHSDRADPETESFEGAADLVVDPDALL